jgi:hypothetical protein
MSDLARVDTRRTGTTQLVRITTYLDSAAIAAFFRLSQRLRDRRQDLRLVVPDGSPIRAVIELTRLSQVIPVDESGPEPGDPMAYAALPHDGAPASTEPPPIADAAEPDADGTDTADGHRNG